MANLYYHRIENFNRLESIKGIEGYCKRVLTMTSPEDFVLLDWYEDIILPIPELELLNNMGLGVPAENIFVVKFDQKKGWRDNYLENKNVIDILRNKSLEKLLPFTGKSSICHFLAQDLGIPIASCPQDISIWAEDKSTLPTLIDKETVTRRFLCRSKEEIYKYWDRLKLLSEFPGMGVIKNCQSASGLGSSVVRDEDDIALFLGTYDFSELGEAVIEEWYNDADSRSPSINVFINKNGSLQEMFISDQIFEEKVDFGKEGTRIHMGNIKPSSFPENICTKIRDITSKVIEGLKENGYWGPAGFDTIVLPNGNVKIIEINPRVTGPHYSYRPAEKMNCEYFQLKNEENLKKDVDIKKLEAALGELLFAPGKSAGYIPFNFYPGKKFTGVAIAKTAEERKTLSKEVQIALAKIKK